jgi:uncharacterized protein (DUF433 family)
MARVWADMRRMGGAPCFYGTRIPVDTVRQMVDFESITLDHVGAYYPALAGRDLSHAIKRGATNG